MRLPLRPTSDHINRSQPALDFLGGIARNSGLMLSGAVRSSLQFLHRNSGIILFLLAASAVGVGAVYGTIWVVKLVCFSLPAVGRWVEGEWQLLLDAGGNVNATVAQVSYAVRQAVKHGWHASTSWLSGILRALRHGNEN